MTTDHNSSGYDAWDSQACEPSMLAVNVRRNVAVALVCLASEGLFYRIFQTIIEQNRLLYLMCYV